MALTHAQKHAPTPASAPRPARSATTASSFTRRPGRWVDGWDPEDAAQWHHAGGAQTARTNLACSVYAEFLGFGVFALWAIVVPQLKKYGYTGSAALSESQQFWLLSVPTLVGASLRVPYTFAVPRFGGRNWTIISSLLLLLPTIGLALAVGQHASFPVLLTVAALAGFGGGNFASSMTNISFFYRSSQKGKALGLNAAGGNLGVVEKEAGAAVRAPQDDEERGARVQRSDRRLLVAGEVVVRVRRVGRQAHLRPGELLRRRVLSCGLVVVVAAHPALPPVCTWSSLRDRHHSVPVTVVRCGQPISAA